MMTTLLACVASRERMRDREWVQSECRAENPGIRRKEDELRLDSWIQVRWTGWNKESEVVQCAWLEDLQHSIEEPWKSQGVEEAGGVEGQPEALHDG